MLAVRAFVVDHPAGIRSVGQGLEAKPLPVVRPEHEPRAVHTWTVHNRPVGGPGRPMVAVVARALDRRFLHEPSLVEVEPFASPSVRGSQEVSCTQSSPITKRAARRFRVPNRDRSVNHLVIEAILEYLEREENAR